MFHEIETRWKSRLRLFPQLPLSAVISVEKSEVTPDEFRFYVSTSVDFTFCDKQEKPMLSIEFDGLGGGFSHDNKYIPFRKTNAPKRKTKLDFKLKLAQQIGYPLVVVSYEEIRPLTRGDSLLIVDGVIGQYLAKQEFQGKIRKRLDGAQQELDQMSEWEQSEYVQGLVLTTEIESELENDPIAIEAAKYDELLSKTFGYTSYSKQPLEDHSVPPPPRNVFPQTHEEIKQFKRRIEALDSAPKYGCRITIETKEKPFSYEVWVRNFNCIGVSPLSILDNIAEYIAFKQTYTYLTRRLKN